MASDERTSPTRPDTAADRYRYKPVVLYGSAVFIVAISTWALITPEGAASTIGTIVG